MKKPKLPPSLVLFILAPAIGELLSGSSPPLEFFNPIVFLLLASLYGSGAILMRELKIRWKKDFRALLLLGAAYGILEEGLMVKSFFDPQWVDLGVLGVYGRWMGVNWVWTEMLIIYHAVFSITIPTVLVELAYPERKGDRWIGKRIFAGLAALLTFVTALGYFFLTPYIPPLTHYSLAIFAMFLFIYIAYKIPSEKQKAREKKANKPKLFWIAGLVSTIIFFLLFWAGPSFIKNPIVLMLFGIAFVFAMLKLLDGFDWENPESAVSKLAIVAGALSFLIFLAFLHELNGVWGMSLVGLASIIGLLFWRRKLKGPGR
ncbi:MAG: hypothetical protein ACUVUF_05345 [Candidatus Bathycorpusculaceae bacterium]